MDRVEVDEPRSALEALCRGRGEDYAALSRLLGRNPAYIQQFIRRGSPRKLDEEDRRTLATYFGIDEAVLGGRASEPPARLVAVPRLDVAAAAGAGALDGSERALASFGFEARWLKQLVGDPSGLSVIAVAGDSMAPTLGDGDEILVDRNDAGGRLRDGIYVLRRDDALLVKRIALDPAGRLLSVRSDNPAYPSWEACAPDSIVVIGRVLWAGRRLA